MFIGQKVRSTSSHIYNVTMDPREQAFIVVYRNTKFYAFIALDTPMFFTMLEFISHQLDGC